LTAKWHNISGSQEFIGITVLYAATFFCEPQGMMESWNLAMMGLKSPVLKTHMISLIFLF